jgi:hypothetical protein
MLCMRRGCARLEESLLSSRQGSSGYGERNCDHGEENMEGFTRKKNVRGSENIMQLLRRAYAKEEINIADLEKKYAVFKKRTY